ncbi:MAG TPA: ABC transporter permease [Puia sp.]|nr:ABC transporter permease [Puia sp.]
MLRNYLHIAFRNIRRNKLYSLANVGCLAIGIAVAMIIMLYVVHEHSYDQWQTNATRIFKVSSTIKYGNSSLDIEELGYQVGPLALRSDSHVESYTRAFKPFQPPVLQLTTLAGSSFTAEAPVLFADSNFFHFFSFRLVRGNPDEVLRRPFTVVLSARAARRFFGNADPIGKVIIYSQDYQLEVTGISADPPSNSTINYDLVVSGSSLSTMKDMADAVKSENMQLGYFQTWLLLKDPSAAGEIGQTIGRVSKSFEAKSNEPGIFHLTALPGVHLHKDPGYSNIRYLTIFPMVAGLVLLLALINYISLSTARGTMRAKEVGVRKVLGAGRFSIASQFYSESTIYALLSFITGIGLFLLFRTFFLQQLQLKIDSSFLLTPEMLLCFAGLLLIVILASGSYPSLVLSAFKPVAVLYGKVSRQKGSERVRKILLVFQFTISMSLILCSLIIRKELHFLRHVDTGMDRENVIMISFSKSLSHYNAFKRDVESIPGIQKAATGQYEPYEAYNVSSTIPHGSDNPIMLPVITVDSDYVSVLGLAWRQRPAEPGAMYGHNNILLNESAVDKLGLHGSPLGQTIKVFGKDREVSGVLQDFNYESLQAKIGPLCLLLRKPEDSLWGISGGGCLIARIQSHVNLPTLIGRLKEIYARYDAHRPFEYSFLDDIFDSLYKTEDRLEALFSIFTGVTVFIACLGLFALATFSARQRMREMGIRKVLGASATSIGFLLLRDFLRPVLLAVLIASPLSWWVMRLWLQDFAYQTSMSWWIFPLAGLGLLLIAVATVLSRSLHVGRANPVNSLRTD